MEVEGRESISSLSSEPGMSGMEKDSERDMVGAGGGGFRSGGGGEGRVRVREEGTMLDGGRRGTEITRKVGSNTFV